MNMENNALDLSRCQDIFKPALFTDKIHIIGAGALGSWVAMMLCKLGIDGEQITVWDYDMVEEGNITNQLFGLKHVGMTKVEALQQIILDELGTKIKINNIRWENHDLSGHVFMLVDSMETRKQIYEKRIKMNPNVKMAYDLRMGIDLCRIYTIDTMYYPGFEKYEETLYGDEYSEVSTCGTSLSIIPSAIITSALGVRKFMEVVNGRDDVRGELIFDYKYDNILSTEWK